MCTWSRTTLQQFVFAAVSSITVARRRERLPKLVSRGLELSRGCTPVKDRVAEALPHVHGRRHSSGGENLSL